MSYIFNFKNSIIFYIIINTIISFTFIYFLQIYQYKKIKTKNFLLSNDLLKKNYNKLFDSNQKHLIKKTNQQIKLNFINRIYNIISLYFIFLYLYIYCF